MRISNAGLAALVVAAFAWQVAPAAELQPGAVEAWNAYVKHADRLMQQRAEGRQPFLWIDESPARLARVRRGEAMIAPLVGHGSEGVPQALLHDWIGAVFIPGASIDGLRSVLNDYGDYQRIYKPVVASSKLLACTDRTQEFQMVWQRKVLFVRAAMEGQFQTHDVALGAHRGYTVSEAVQIREIEGYGHKDERRLPPDTGHGFIWRIRSISRYEERDGGVFLEVEALALTRDIPPSVAWFVNPVINHLSVNSLTATLRQTRDAVSSSRTAVKKRWSCPALTASRQQRAVAQAERPSSY